MNNKIYIDIELDQKSPFIKGTLISGHIVLKPKEDLDVEYFSYCVLHEQRGLASTETNHIKYITSLANDILFSNNETYLYPIKFKVTNHENYKGVNIELLIKIEATIKLKNSFSVKLCGLDGSVSLKALVSQGILRSLFHILLQVNCSFFNNPN